MASCCRFVRARHVMPILLLAAVGCTSAPTSVLGESVGAVGDESGNPLGSVGFELWDPTAAEPGDTTSGDADPNEPADTPLDPEPDDADPDADFAGAVVIEPDDYADRTVLTSISAAVALSVTGSDNLPGAFEVTANDDGFDFAPTGAHVFGHSNVGFFNSERRMRMDFATPARAVRIDFAGGTYFETEIGRLEVYDVNGARLAEYVTQPLGSGEPETMMIVRESADIAWAIAYVAAGEGSFGRLDNLRFVVGD